MSIKQLRVDRFPHVNLHDVLLIRYIPATRGTCICILQKLPSLVYCIYQFHYFLKCQAESYTVYSVFDLLSIIADKCAMGS